MEVVTAAAAPKANRKGSGTKAASATYDEHERQTPLGVLVEWVAFVSCGLRFRERQHGVDARQQLIESLGELLVPDRRDKVVEPLRCARIGMAPSRP